MHQNARQGTQILNVLGNVPNKPIHEAMSLSNALPRKATAIEIKIVLHQFCYFIPIWKPFACLSFMYS